MPMKPKQVANELLAIYSQALDSSSLDKQHPGRIKAIRPSQLPFCPVSFFIRHATHGVYRSMDMRGNFFVNIGTSMHTVLQTFLGKHTHNGKGVFLGDWQCKICRKKYPLSFKNECCDFSCHYEEIGIDFSFKKHPTRKLVGHIDAVYRDKAGNYWVVDYKSTSLRGALGKSKTPGVVYQEQIETYAAFLRLQYGIKVKGIILFFVPRDDPSQPVMWTKTLDIDDIRRIIKRTKRYMRQHEEVMNVETKAEAMALAKYGSCSNYFCKECKKPDLKSALLRAFKSGLRKNYLPLTTL